MDGFDVVMTIIGAALALLILTLAVLVLVSWSDISEGRE